MNYQKLIIYLHGLIGYWISKCFAYDDIYRDNVTNRTPIKRLTDFEEQITLEREILSLMGFPETPKNPDRAPIRKRSAPNYMLSIYMNDQGEKVEEPLPEPKPQVKPTVKPFVFTKDNRRRNNDSDITINFMAENSYKGVKPDRDILEIPENYILTHAELKLYRITEGLRQKFRGAYKIIVNRVLKDEQTFEFVDSVNTPADYEGWITLNVTSLVDYWTKNPDDNHGLKIEVVPIDQEDHRLTPELIGIVGFDSEDEKQPLMTGFFKNIISIDMNDQEENANEPLPEPKSIVKPFGFTEDNDRKINEKDVIVNFMAENPHKGGKPDRVRRMWFDISEIPEDKILTYAELRLYRITEGLRKKFRGAYKITVNRVFKNKDGKNAFEFVDSVNTPADYEGWITLNVTSLLDYWTKNPDDNRGVRIDVVPIDRKDHLVRPELIGIVGFDGEDEKQPLITGFFKNIMSIDMNDQKENDKEPLPEPKSKVKPFAFTEANRRIINESDVIVSFMAENPHKGGKPDRVRRMWFDVSEIPEDDILTYAELRLYRITEGLKKKFRGAYKIIVNRVFKDEAGEKAFEFVDSVNTPADYEGWITLNVTSLLDYWTKNPNDNRGLKIEVVPIDREGRRVRPEFIGIVGFDGEDEEQPFIAGFYKNINENKIQLKMEHIFRRYKRDDEYSTLDSFTERQLRQKWRPLTYSHACARKNFHVSFKEIRWHEWIIAPEGFDAYYCDGKCNYPLATHMNATNHAIVQSLVHRLHPNKVPSPCCIPTQLSSISVLYFLHNNNVVYKKFKNMVVNGCGCH